ncbi:MAG: response regulator, partial [Oleiharenicola lentus]
MQQISTLIVDDEPLARERLRGLLKAEPGISVIGECENGADALLVIRHAQPDLVFLDMQMPGCDGLQFIARLPAGRRPAIIFATAHERFALDAFDAAAVDYLLKPFDRERLRVALDRAREHLRRRAAAEPGARPEPAGPSPRNSRLAVKTDGRIVF